MSQPTKNNIVKKSVRPVVILLVLVTLAVLVTSCAGPWNRRGHHHYMNDMGFSQDGGIKYGQDQDGIF
jgi:hypothetical protein